MHEVGRRYGAEHRLTLEPADGRASRSSNDPTCSAGFGMGLVMYLGPQIIVTGGRSALVECLPPADALPLVHVRPRDRPRADARRTTGTCAGRSPRAARLGAQAPDCAQGAFHDYWISLRGADGTTLRQHGVSPRFLCNGHLWYVRPCWYRYFVEQADAPIIDSAASIRRACAGLRALQRYGCVSGAALSDPGEPARAGAHLLAAGRRRRARLPARRGRPGVRAPSRRSSAPSSRMLHADARAAPSPTAASWFGRTLALVTNGRFALPRPACREGAALTREPLVTFS